MTRYFGLSKSRIAAFEQCPRRLWLQVHQPDEVCFDKESTLSFAGGHAVGTAACGCYTPGTFGRPIGNKLVALRYIRDGHISDALEIMGIDRIVADFTNGSI